MTSALGILEIFVDIWDDHDWLVLSTWYLHKILTLYKETHWWCICYAIRVWSYSSNNWQKMCDCIVNCKYYSSDSWLFDQLTCVDWLTCPCFCCWLTSEHNLQMCIYKIWNVDQENIIVDRKLLLWAIGSTIRVLSFWDYHKQ